MSELSEHLLIIKKHAGNIQAELEQMTCDGHLIDGSIYTAVGDVALNITKLEITIQQRIDYVKGNNKD